MDRPPPNARPTMPRLTPELPTVHGRIKTLDDDFAVEEVPAYRPCGEGTHTYLFIEKRGMTTMAAASAIARGLGRHPRDVGYAGLKDARAVTRQWLSVEHVTRERVESLNLPRIRVLATGLHRNKLRRGHLAGNRFMIRVRSLRGDPSEGVARVRGTLHVLQDRGVPNYFGPQRFGARGDNARIGTAALVGDYETAVGAYLGDPDAEDRDDLRRARRLFAEGAYAEARDAWPASHRQEARACAALARGGGFRAAWATVDRRLRKLYLNAVQSALFNRVVAERITALDRLEVGDLAWIHRNGACLRVEDAEREQPRCDAFEISPSGPLFGRKMTPASGEPGRREARVLDEAAIGHAGFQTPDGMVVDGARRPLRVPLGDCDVTNGDDEHGAFIQLAFALPPGAYATSVMREVLKDADADGDEAPSASPKPSWPR